ncbi:MAG: bifunctional isocitrate dehydrogenase kinase/phosphatase [Candidatus Eisenbacteria bacterium]|nr:bifunctional isocitrate dehydrogenase kinase/phosphatase [Candidatus Eisenbacteria bacterium]
MRPGGARADAAEVAMRLLARWRQPDTADRGDLVNLRIEIVRSVFYRMKHAYLVGRASCGEVHFPFILALLHDDDGVFVDAVLLEEDEASVLFSFTRAYFSVVAPDPDELVLFLRSILPRKPAAELYLSIGFYKHGKTEVYRRLVRHLESSHDQFVIAEGERGMVMLVFLLPSFDLVFKLIRDHFAPPKTMGPDDVKQRYRLVFERDRVGRLVEAQSFEHLRFPTARFSPALLAELRTATARSVRIDDDFVHLDFLYVERRVRPLDLYVREVDKELARRAIIDYGNAIKELAAANIFPGDFLLKNFGVTRHRRVAFYDYDELCLLTDCNFRDLPVARTLEEELAAEPWYAVGPNDIFPEQFGKFLGIPVGLMDAFLEHHGDLLDPRFWRGLQDRLRAGEVPDVYPYAQRRRLGTGGARR